MEVPARDGQHAVVGKMPQKVRPRLDRVERVLSEHERPCRRRRPGIDERDLNRAIALRRPGDEAARFVVDESDARIAVQMACEITEAAVHRADDVLVDVDGGHRPRAERERRQDVAPAAGTDHEGVVTASKVVGDVRDVVLEVLDGAEITVEV